MVWSWLIATPTIYLPLATRYSLPFCYSLSFSVVADRHSNRLPFPALWDELPFAPTIRQSPFAIRCRFLSWLVATPTNHSPVAIRYSLLFFSLLFTAHWATPP
jgi:hypothetical protein